MMRLSFLVVILGFTFFAVSNLAYAQQKGVIDRSTTSNVSRVDTAATSRIIGPIEITENTALNFGSVVRPESGSVVVTVAPDGSTSVSNGQSFLLLGGSNPGSYNVLGETGFNANLVLRTGVCNTPAISWQGLSVDTSPIISLPANDIQLGGSLQITSAATPGNYSCDYTIEASYF